MITREELYALVWAEPMIKVAERYDVSGTYLACICALLNVPRPPRGHWQKLAVGKAAPQDALPEALPSDQVTWNEKGERFLEELSRSIDQLPEDERAVMAERLKLAKEFMGMADPLEFFRGWRTPREI